jgi:hypothetical protein
VNSRRNALYGVVALLLAILLAPVSVEASTQYATGCPHEEQECELVGWECVDWDASGWCIAAWTAACFFPCKVVGGWFMGFTCSMGCNAISWELCKFCEEWEYHWVCHCPGGANPESAIPPVVLILEEPLIPEE